ncbi:MAG: ParB/RepB/Spo0J family partition protein [Cytophagales bacterium]
MVNKRNTLGRGLGSLLGGDDQKIKNNLFEEIEINKIEINPDQPRKKFNEKNLKELTISIKNYGIIQPITVRKLSENKFQLISGERRFRASKIAGLKKIPSFIKDAEEKEMLELALIENIQRENLNSIEISISYKKLLNDLKINQEELADKVGKDRSTINNYLRLLKLPPSIQNGILENKIQMGHARSLITIEKSEVQLEIYNAIIKKGLSVRKTEELVRSLNRLQKSKTTAFKSKEIEKLEGKLSSHFGTKIFTSGNNSKGKIIIPYKSTNDLNRILEILDII